MNDAGQPDLPLVLCHGFLGFDQIEIGGFNPIHYFQGIQPALEEEGCTVRTVQVSRTKSIQVRAEQMKSQVESMDDRVHLVAHSMGGLDARYYISRLDGHETVVSLTTLGTPHRGSSFADWFANNRFRGKTLVKMLGVNIDGLHQLTREYLRTEFNPDTPDHPDVHYVSYGGRTSREDVPAVLRPSFDVIDDREGPNDGLVPVTSAEWGSSFTELEADHMDLVNWSQSFDAIPLYTEIAHRAAAVERDD